MKYHSIIILLLVCFIAGCGSKEVGVQGTVVYSDDGSPVAGGVVIFSTPTFQASGGLNAQGRFTISGNTIGLPPGTYKVAVSGPTEDLDESGLSTYELVDPKFSSISTSGIEITVDKNTKNLDIKVDRNPAPRPNGK